MCAMLSPLEMCRYTPRHMQQLLHTGPHVRACLCAPLVHVVGAGRRPRRLAAGLRPVHRLCRVPQLHDWLLRCIPSTGVWGFCRCAAWAACLVRGCSQLLLLLPLLGLCCQWRLCIVCRIPELLDVVC